MHTKYAENRFTRSIKDISMYRVFTSTLYVCIIWCTVLQCYIRIGIANLGKEGVNLKISATGQLVEVKSRQRRRLAGLGDKWPNATIPWVFVNSSEGSITSLSNKVKENVLKAIQHLEDNTCLRFLRFDDALPDLKFYLRIGKDSAGGCYANIGRMRESKQPQVVSLSGPGCEDVGSVIHELGHIVGLHHEHSRKDRNKYIKVNFKNVRENAMLNFMMMEGVETLAEYDVGSIMHYGTYDFSRNSEPTIEVRDQALSFLAGNRRGLSYYDIKSLSKAYRCTVQCPYRLSCENGGFLHSLKGNTDCFCKCPDGLAGNTCNRIDPRAMSGPHGFCGGVISLSLSWFDRAFIHSPRFPFNYPRRQKCLWLLKGPTGSVIKLSFIYFDIKADSNKCIHWLEVRSNLVGQPGPRYCGRWNGGIIVSKDQHNNMMVVKFDSTEHVGYATTGFAAIASAIVTPDTF